MEQQYDRFKDAPWFPKEKETCLIGGCGGIGSWLTFFLAKSGFSPILFDDDVIEEHNIGGQLFREQDIGKKKIVAMTAITRDYCGTEIDAYDQRVTEFSMSHHFSFSAFDNMKARKDLFECWKRSISNSAVLPLFIDGRLELEQLQIFCVTPDRIEEYEKYLFDDSVVEDGPCTLKQTANSAAMIATLMSSFFNNHMANIKEREVYRTVPFYYEFFSPIVLTNLIPEE